MRFQCPFCKELLSVEDTETGADVKCVHCSKTVKVPASRTAPGSVIGDFIILHELGRGGMGIVYSAHQISLDRPAALKILADSFSKNSDFVVGFIKEARAAAKLNHPNIVQAYAVGDDDGIFYFAMEYIDGETMKNILKRDTVIPVDRAIDIVRQIAEALDYAWQEEKLVHRDIKPDNIMLTANGRAKLADLGLAKVGNDPGQVDGEEVMGTPQYISPEQLTGEPLDNRTDIYCLGATFYHFLTGRFPYEGASAVEIARQHLDGTLIPPNQVNPDIPETVSRVVEKMMAKEPSQRYQSAGSLAEDLALIKRGQNPAVATISGSIRVQSSNREEAVSKPIPPKLRMPGKVQPSATDTIAEKPSSSKPRSAPKLMIPGKGKSDPPPVLSDNAKAQPPVLKKPAAPQLAPKPPAAPPPQAAEANAGAQRQTSEKKQVKRKKETGPSVASLVVKAVIGLLILLAAGGVAVYVLMEKGVIAKKKPSELITGAREAIKKVAAQPEPSEFMKAAAPVVKLIRGEQSNNRDESVRQCYAFLKKQLLPETEEEKNLVREITSFLVQHDEGNLEELRVQAIEKYEAEQERKRLAAEEAARKQMEADRLAREQEANRKNLEAERARKQAEKQRVINAFKSRMNRLEHQMILDLVRYAEKHDAAGLQAVFEKNIAEQQEAPRELVGYARPLVNRARNLQSKMKSAWEWEKIFTDGDPALEGLQIELKNNICMLTRIRDGVIYAKTISGREYSAPVKELLGNRKFQLFAVNAAFRLKKKDSLPFYFFWMCNFAAASRVARDASNAGRNIYSRFVTDYLKEAVKEPSVKAGLAAKFKNVPEYERMFPVRRPPAPKPAPKKPAVKKPAAKRK